MIHHLALQNVMQFVESTLRTGIWWSSFRRWTDETRTHCIFLVHQNRGYGAGANVSLMIASVPPAKFGW